LALLKILQKINNIYEKAYLNNIEVPELKNKYEKQLKEAIRNLDELLKNI
jgi:hypothetical protein